MYFQYVNKYSAAFWGTSFVREMTKINVPVDTAQAQAVKNDENHIAELKRGQAELKMKKEDSKGSEIVNGSVPPTPAGNAISGEVPGENGVNGHTNGYMNGNGVNGHANGNGIHV